MDNFLHCLYLGLVRFFKTSLTGLFKGGPLGGFRGSLERDRGTHRVSTSGYHGAGELGDLFQRNLNSDFIFQKYILW